MYYVRSNEKKKEKVDLYYWEKDYRAWSENSNLDYDDTTSSSSSGLDSFPEAKKPKLDVSLKAAKKEKYINNLEKRLNVFIKDSTLSAFHKKCHIRDIIEILEFTISEVLTFVVQER
ncbi:hypothetical protein V9T40_011012 [Parthenolecanium corni]|uniref:Uncharacterized protein n=1 Tax=Parthenolecanium corni TaxID=536013 RepID=A0AAN9XXR0_9HEMI